MATHLEKAYIHAAIVNPEVAKKLLDMIDWYDNGGSGGGGAVYELDVLMMFKESLSNTEIIELTIL